MIRKGTNEPQDCSASTGLRRGTERVCGAMDAHILEATLKMHIDETRQRLEQAVGIARAAQACVEAGNFEKAIEIVLDVEQLIYEVNTFLNAASMMHRLGKT